MAVSTVELDEWVRDRLRAKGLALSAAGDPTEPELLLGGVIEEARCRTYQLENATGTRAATIGCGARVTWQLFHRKLGLVVYEAARNGVTPEAGEASALFREALADSLDGLLEVAEFNERLDRGFYAATLERGGRCTDEVRPPPEGAASVRKAEIEVDGALGVFIDAQGHFLAPGERSGALRVRPAGGPKLQATAIGAAAGATLGKVDGIGSRCEPLAAAWEPDGALRFVRFGKGTDAEATLVVAGEERTLESPPAGRGGVLLDASGRVAALVGPDARVIPADALVRELGLFAGDSDLARVDVPDPPLEIPEASRKDAVSALSATNRAQPPSAEALRQFGKIAGGSVLVMVGGFTVLVASEAPEDGPSVPGVVAGAAVAGLDVWVMLPRDRRTSVVVGPGSAAFAARW